MKVLVGDIGGTHVRLLFAEVNKTSWQCIAETSYSSHDFSNLTDILTLFINENEMHANVSYVCLAVAGPVNSGIAKVTNLPWIISEKELSATLKISHVKLINDFIAVAYGVHELKNDEVVVLHEAEGINKGTPTKNAIVIGAGTGLGAAHLVRLGDHFLPLPSEVGHAGFAPENTIQTQLLAWLQKSQSHVSLEMLLSGRGLVTIYNFFHDVVGLSESEEVNSAMLHMDPAQVISEYALENKEPLCVQALDCFVEIYGAAAGNIALHYFSAGELYIAGGIAAKIKDKMSEPRFLNAFFNKGLMSENMKKITVKLVLQNKVGLYGALAYIKEHI